LYCGYKILEVFETVIYEDTAANTPDFKGTEYIKKLIFYKTISSDPIDYNEEVL